MPTKRGRKLTAKQKQGRAKRAALPTVMIRAPREFADYVAARAQDMTEQTGIRHTGADVMRLMLARSLNA